MRQLNNWLEGYKNYTKKNEAPHSFHLFSALWALSAAIGRKAWLDFSYYTIFPNVFIVLTGPPATKKSTACRIAASLVDELEYVHMGPNMTTKESLIQELSHSTETFNYKGHEESHCSIAITSPEWSNLMGEQDREFCNALCELYDCDRKFDKWTKTQGKDKIRNVFLTMLAGSTIRQITDCLPMSAIGGGFTSRIVFIVESEDRWRKSSLPKLGKKEYDMKVSLTEDLKDIGNNIKGEFKFTEGGARYYDIWYKERVEKLLVDDKFIHYCLEENTPILMKNLTWKPIKDIREGDKVLSFNKNSTKGQRRGLKTATVTGTHSSEREAYKIVTECGELVTTQEHKILRNRTRIGARKDYRWDEVRDLETGMQLPFVSSTWEKGISREIGWLAGIADGEGSLSVRKWKGKIVGINISISQKSGIVFNELLRILNKLEIYYSIYKNNDVNIVQLNRTQINKLKFLGVVGPHRLMDKYHSLIDEAKLAINSELVTINSIKPYGKTRVVDISTTSGTFIANGFMVHNCDRKPTHVLKFAMLLSACKSNDMVIGAGEIADAIKLLTDVEDRMPEALGGVGLSVTAPIIAAISGIMRDKKRASQRQLQNILWRDANKDELRLALMTMIDAGNIERDENGMFVWRGR